MYLDDKQYRAAGTALPQEKSQLGTGWLPKEERLKPGGGREEHLVSHTLYIAYWDTAYESALTEDGPPECYGYITRAANLLQTENWSDMMRLEQMRNYSWLPGTDTGMASHGMCTV